MVVLRKLRILCCLRPFLAQAEIYKWTDSHGRIHFSDKPVAGAQKQHLQDITGIANPAFNLQRMRIPYQNQHGSMIVQGKVNRVPVQFVLDTGASLVVIPPAVVKKARINTRNAPAITMQTANGAARSFVVRIGQLQIGTFKQQNVPAAVQQISSDPNLGLLGMSFLGAYKMSIDHKQHMITLEPRR